MKKTIMALCLAGVAVGASAQSVRFGVEAGVNCSFPTDFDCTRAGFSAGVFSEVAIKKGWFGTFGFTLESKPIQYSHGYYYEAEGMSTHYGAKATPYYLTVPLNVGYRWKVGRDCSLSVAAGAYASLGLFGKGQQTIGGVVQPGKYDFFDSYGRIDRGLCGNVGLELGGHYRLGLGFQKGLYNLQKYAPKVNHNVLNLSLGYKF